MALGQTEVARTLATGVDREAFLKLAAGRGKVPWSAKSYGHRMTFRGRFGR
jgi:hypothetical protein